MQKLGTLSCKVRGGFIHLLERGRCCLRMYHCTSVKEVVCQRGCKVLFSVESVKNRHLATRFWSSLRFGTLSFTTCRTVFRSSCLKMPLTGHLCVLSKAVVLVSLSNIQPYVLHDLLLTQFPTLLS